MINLDHEIYSTLDDANNNIQKATILIRDCWEELKEGNFTHVSYLLEEKLELMLVFLSGVEQLISDTESLTFRNILDEISTIERTEE